MAESERAVDSSVREVRPDLRVAYVVDPCEAKSFELDDLADPEGPDRGLRHPAGFRPVRHDDVRVHALRDPLDLRNVLVLHRNELRPAVESHIAEILQPDLMTPEPLEILAGDMHFRSGREGALPAPREVGMKRSLDRPQGREAFDVHRHRIGHKEVPVRLLIDRAAVLRVQRLRGHLDIREAEAEREDERTKGGGPDPPPPEALQRPRPRVVVSAQAARPGLAGGQGPREFDVLESKDPQRGQSWA